MDTEETQRRSSRPAAADRVVAADAAPAGRRATYRRSLPRVGRSRPRPEDSEGTAAWQAEGAGAEGAAGEESASYEAYAEECSTARRAPGRGGGGETAAEAAAAEAAPEAVHAAAEDDSREAPPSATLAREMVFEKRESCCSCGRASGEQRRPAAGLATAHGEQAAAAPHAEMRLQEPEGQERRRRSTVQIIQKKEKECYCVTELCLSVHSLCLFIPTVALVPPVSSPAARVSHVLPATFPAAVFPVDYIPRYWTTDLMCCFTTRPQYILLIKRINSPRVTRQAAELATFLATRLNFTVLVEPAAAEEMAKATSHAVPLKTWSLDGPTAPAAGRRSTQFGAAVATSQRGTVASGSEAPQPIQEVFDRGGLAGVCQRLDEPRGAAAAGGQLHGHAQGRPATTGPVIAHMDVPCRRAFGIAGSAAIAATSRVGGAATAAAPSSRLAAAATSTTRSAAVRRSGVLGFQVEETPGVPSSSAADIAVPPGVHALRSATSAQFEGEQRPAQSPASAVPAAALSEIQREVNTITEGTPPAQQQAPPLRLPWPPSFGNGEKVATASPCSTDAVTAAGVGSAAESLEELTPVPGSVRVARPLLPLHAAAATTAAAAGAAPETVTAPASRSASVTGSPLFQQEDGATAVMQPTAAAASCAVAAFFSSSNVAVPPAAAGASARAHLSAGASRDNPGKAEESFSPSLRTGDSPRVPPVLCDSIDLVVALGGDGTMLWVSQLFAESVPPVIGVAMGSLGYLTRFTLRAARRQLRAMAACKRFSVNLRCRLKVSLLSKEGAVLETFVAFNECVIDRGYSSNLCTLDVFCNGAYFTTVAADGLILATPTGSTAYSMSAGGSMVHPKVPCLLFTPICPHTLSFRPVILPDSVELRIVAPEDARGSVWIAVDGRSRTQVEKGMQVLVSLSAFPFPMVSCSTPSSQDAWLESLKKTLNWNCRVRQGDTPAGEGEVQQRETAGRGSTTSSSTSRSASSSRSIIRSDRRSRDSSAFDSSDGDAGSCERNKSSRRTSNMNDSSSRRSSDGTARDGGATGKSCETYYRRCGDARLGRRNSGSTSSTGRSSRLRTSNETGADSLRLVHTASRSTSGKGLGRRFAADAEEAGNCEDRKEDGTTYGSMVSSRAAPDALDTNLCSCRSSSLLRRRRRLHRGMQRKRFQSGGRSSSRHRRSSCPSISDSRSDNKRSRSHPRCNEVIQGRTDGGTSNRSGRSRSSSRELRRSSSRNSQKTAERSGVLSRRVMTTIQEDCSQWRRAEAQNFAAAARRAVTSARRTAAAEGASEEDGGGLVRRRQWVGAATPRARESHRVQEQQREEVSTRGPLSARLRKRMHYYVQKSERVGQQQLATHDQQDASSVLSGGPTTRPPLAALHCLSRAPAGNAAAAVAAAAPAIAAVAAVSSSPDDPGAPASRRLPATATFISLPAAAAAAARADEQQAAAGVTEHPVGSFGSPPHRQIFLCDEQVTLPGKRTIVKYAATSADGAAAAQERTRKETGLQEAGSDPDMEGWWLQQQQLVLPTGAGGVCAATRVSRHRSARDHESHFQQQAPEQQHSQQQQQKQQQHLQHEGERHGQHQTGKRLQVKPQQQCSAPVVCGEERREQHVVTCAGEAVRTVTWASDTAAGGRGGRRIFPPMFHSKGSSGGCVATAALSTRPAGESRSSSACCCRSRRAAAAVQGRSDAEAYSCTFSGSHEISSAGREHQRRRKFRPASYQRQRRSFSPDWSPRRQHRPHASTYALRPYWVLDRVYTVNSRLPYGSSPSALEVAEETTGAGGAASEARLYEDGKAVAEQSHAEGAAGEAAGVTRGRGGGTVEPSGGGATPTRNAVVKMRKIPGGTDTAFETICASPSSRKQGAAVGLPDECRTVGLSGSSNRIESGAESRWNTCGSMREAADISLEDESNNVAADSDRTCPHGRVGTGRHEFDSVVTDDAGCASVGSTSPSNTRAHTTDSKQGGQNLFVSDFSKHSLTEGDEPMDSSSLPVMSSPAPPVGGFRAETREDIAATGGAHTYPDAATEHTVTALRDAVRDNGETAAKDVGIDVAAVDTTSTPRVRPPVASRNAVLAETCRGPQELQQEGKVAQPGVGTEAFKKGSWGVDSAFRPHTRAKKFTEEETQRRDNTGAVNLQEPSTTASVHHQEDSGSGRKVKAKADAAEREMPPADAPSTENTSVRYRAAIEAGRTRATGAASNRHVLTRRSSVSSNLQSTSASRNGESAVNRKRRSRVSCLRKCVQIGRRMRMRLSLRLRHRWTSAGTRGARSLLLGRQILAITQEQRRMRQPSAPASTTELTLSLPSSSFSSLRCTAPPATGATGDSAAAARCTSALLPHRCSDALTSCCDATTYCSTSPTSMGVLQLLERKRQETEQSAADDVTAVCKSERCLVWLAAAAQLAGLEQSEKTSPERVSENGVLPPSTCDSRRSGSHERIATSRLAGQPKRVPTAGSTRWEERSSRPLAGYMHQGGRNRTSAVFDGSKEEGSTLAEQSRGAPSTLETCYCDGKRDQEQQSDGTLEKGTDESVRDRGGFTKQHEEGAQQEGDGQDLRQREKNGSQSKEGRERTEKETAARHSKVAKQEEEHPQKQRLLHSADTCAFVGVGRVTGGIERQRGSTARLTKDFARGATVDSSMCYSDTAGTQEQRRGGEHDDFQQNDASPVMTFASAEAGVLAQAASGNVADDACVAGSTALLNGNWQTENSVACDRSRQLTGAATLERAASPACGSSRRAVGEPPSSTRKSRALCEATNRTAATGASTLSFPTVAGAAPSEVANGAAVWNMSPETVRLVSAVESCINYGSCKRKPEWQPVHISNDVAFSSQERRACDSAGGVPPAVGAVLPQTLFRQRPSVQRESVQGSDEEVDAVDDACNCESQAGSRTGTLSKNCSISKPNDSDCSCFSHKNDCSRQEKDSSSSGPISSSERHANRKSFLCPGARGKAPTHASQQRWQPGAGGSGCTSGAVSALPLAVQKRPQHDHHDSLGATDTAIFHMGCRLAEAAKETPRPPPKRESNDSPAPAFGESTLRSSTSASVSSHSPAPPFLPAQYSPTRPPCFAVAAPVGATSFSPRRQKSRVCTAEKAGGLGEQPHAQQSCCLTTAVARDVSFSWPEHRERALEQTGEPNPSSHVSVNVKSTSQQRLPAQSSSSVKDRLETIEEDLVDCRTSVRERELQLRKLKADDTRQDNSEAAAVRRTKRSNIPRCAFRAGTLVSDFEGIAEEDEEARRRDRNMCGNLLKHSRTLSSLRPSSSADKITHSSERTKRILTQATSVFMLPTDRCTAVVRLVSSASRTSLELFRDVREVTASSASTLLSPSADETTSTRRSLHS